MANIFISHSTIDKDLANYLCNAFEARGLSCWIAPRDIVPGAEWAVSITNAISEADVLFVLYSKNSIKSNQVSKEIGIADRKGKYIIPYKIDDTEPEGAFDYYLTGCHWVIVDPDSGDYKIDELCENIRRVIKERENKEAEEIKEKENIEAEAIKALENIECSEVKKEVAVTPKPMQQPVVPNPVQQKIATAKARNNSAAKKERRNLLIGGSIVLAVVLFLIVGIACVVFLVGKTGSENSDNTNQDGITSIFDFTDSDDFEYEVSNGSVMITGYTGADTDIIIPEVIDDLPVKYIEEKAFYCNADLTSVVIPEGVTEIPKFAFYKCTNLSSVTIPDSVVIIGEHSFEGCTSLSKVVLSDNVNIIDDFAFNNCTGLTEIMLGNGVTAIGNYSFASCEALMEIQLPDSVNSIGNMAFAYCTEVPEVLIPEDILSISNTAFCGCLNIKIIYKGETYSHDISDISASLSGSEE